MFRTKGQKVKKWKDSKATCLLHNKFFQIVSMSMAAFYVYNIHLEYQNFECGGVNTFIYPCTASSPQIRGMGWVGAEVSS